LLSFFFHLQHSQVKKKLGLTEFCVIGPKKLGLTTLTGSFFFFPKLLSSAHLVSPRTLFSLSLFILKLKISLSGLCYTLSHEIFWSKKEER